MTLAGHGGGVMAGQLTGYPLLALTIVVGLVLVLFLSQVRR